MANKKQQINTRVAQILRDRVAGLMKARGKTQADLQKSLKRSRAWASEFLGGTMNVSMSQIDQLAAFFDVPIHVLFGSDLSSHTGTTPSGLSGGFSDGSASARLLQKRIESDRTLQSQMQDALKQLTRIAAELGKENREAMPPSTGGSGRGRKAG